MIKKVLDAAKRVKAFFSGFPDDPKKQIESNYEVCNYCQGEIEDDKGERRKKMSKYVFHIECLREVKKIAKNEGLGL